MSKIFNGNYTRLDDDVSFQILRTNPVLTTNTKLMYDGENMYFESYDANPLLTSQRYKNVKIKGASPFNRDLRQFLVGTGDVAYDVFHNASDLVISGTYDEQFETMYWCGAESINSKMYPQELGFIAPLYLRKKLPNYFVIFKVDGPSNYNLNLDDKGNVIDDEFDYNEDILSNAKLIKSFDLREGTPIGNYIKKYTEQKNFEFDKSIYVNFSTREITYYGIDKYEGVLVSKKENFKTELLENDNTVLHSDDWITGGFKRNNLIFPYIINFEFLFDDNDTKDFKFARYFGMYCNDIDLFDFEAKYDSDTLVVENPENLIQETIINRGNKNIQITFSRDEEMNNNTFDRNDKTSIYYVKDKNDDLHMVADIYKNFYKDNNTNILEIVDGEFDLSTICGFNNDSVSTYCERLDKYGYSEFSFTINKKFRQAESIHFYNELYNPRFSFNDDSDSDGGVYEFATFVADEDIPAGSYLGTRFSTQGTLSDMIKSLCDCINALPDEKKYFDAIYKGNVVVIKSMFSSYNDSLVFNIECDYDMVVDEIVTINNNTKELEGGTTTLGCTFKVSKDDVNQFKNGRYLKTYSDKNNNAKILSCIPYINDDNELETDYYEVTTDDNGLFVGVSNTNQVEIVDRFYPKFGILSFFPLKDFDFDTVFSSYGSNTAFLNECKNLDKKSDVADDTFEDSDSDSDYTDVYDDYEEDEYIKYDTSVYVRKKIESIADGYLKDDNGKLIESEYEYFMENLIPELTLKNKVVPYITKWGYYDDSLDSCENKYRLNMSKIFGTSNLSSNTYTDSTSVFEHTHSMPYYISNDISLCNTGDEYQYIFNSIGLDSVKYDSLEDSDSEDSDRNKTEYDSFVDRCVEIFMNTDVDKFDELLYTKRFGNKRFIRRYSRFKLGNENNDASTMFRGVKFDIKKIVDGEEIKSSYYNDYKFVFLYIPVELSSIYFNNTVYFVKNDKFKYIVGFVVVNTLSGGVKIDSYLFNDYNVDDFTKAYMYGGCYGLLNLPKINNLNGDCNGNTITFTNMKMDDVFNIKIDDDGDVNVNILGINGTSIQKILKNVDDRKSITSVRFHTVDNSISRYYDNILCEDGDRIYISNYLLSTRFHVGDKMILVDLVIKNKLDDFGESLVFKDFYSIFDRMSTYNIKTNINGDIFTQDNLTSQNIKYYSTSGDEYKIVVRDAITVGTYDVFTCSPQIVEESGVGSPVSSAIALKSDLNQLSLKFINRYSGYYNPIFNDIFMYDDFVDDDLVTNARLICKFSNTKFDTSYSDRYGKFGYIRNLWFHKVNENNPNDIITMMSPYYPLLGQFAIDYRDYNVFESNWDKNYFTTQLDLTNTEMCPGTCGMLNSISMFGSKYMNVPEEITIDTLNGSVAWDDDYITDSSIVDSDMMWKEVNGNTLNLYLFLHKRIVRYFVEESGLFDEFVKYINPIYSYGNKNEVYDDVVAYVEKNIMKLYELDNIKLWVKRRKVGVYDKDIDNDYETYLTYDTNMKIKNNLQKVNTYTIQKITNDLFDKKIVYNLRSGYEEKFGLSFTIKKI